MTKIEQILEFIKFYKQDKGVSPTFREICAACNIKSTSSVTYYLDRLEKRGDIKRYNHVARGIVLCPGS